MAGAGGEDNGSFSLAGASLKTAVPFDFEARSTYSILVRVTDKAGLSHDQPFTISVTNVNEAPVLSNVIKSVATNAAVDFAAEDFAAAFADPDGDLLGQVKIVSLPASGTLTLAGATVKKGGTIPADQLSGLVYTPRAGFAGSDRFSWNASDGLLSALTAALVDLTVQ